MTKKKLYNIYGKKQLKDQLKNENFNRITCSFYNYHKIQNLEELRDFLYNDFSNIWILGRVYLAEEGINAQISVPEKYWNDFSDLITKYDFSKNIHIKSAIQEGASFLKLKIMIKKEIVAWGLDKKDYDMQHVGQHLNAKDFNKPTTTAEPAISYFISSINLAGFNEIPPVSKQTPLPTNANGFCFDPFLPFHSSVTR